MQKTILSLAVLALIGETSAIKIQSFGDDKAAPAKAAEPEKKGIPAKAADEAPIVPKESPAPPAVGAKNPKVDPKAPKKPEVPTNVYTTKTVTIGSHTTDAFTTQDVNIGSQAVRTIPTYAPTSIYPVVTSTWKKTDFAQKLV